MEKEAKQISENLLKKNELLNKKKKRTDSLNEEKNNLYNNIEEKKEEIEIIKNNEVNNNYEISEIPDKDNIIKKLYQFITKLNISQKKYYLLKEIELFQIKFQLMDYISYVKFLINGEEIVIEEKPRIISFIEEKEKKIYKRYIYSPSSLEEALNTLDFQSYYVKTKNSNRSNFEEISNNSTLSVYDYNNIYSNENISEIYKYNINPILSKKNFISRQKVKLDFLKDLSNISYLYYGDRKDDKFIFFKKYLELLEPIKKLMRSFFTQTMYLFGPKGASKTTFLHLLKYKFLDLKIYSFYLDYFYLNQHKNEFELIKKVIFHELLYTFSDYEGLILFEQQKIFHSVSFENNTLSLIFRFLKKFIEILDSLCLRKKVVIIIDNIYVLEEKEKNCEEKFLEKIISLNNSCFSNIKMILSGSGQFFNKKYLQIYRDCYLQKFCYPEAGYYLTLDNDDLKLINSIMPFDANNENMGFNDFDQLKISEEVNYLAKYPLIGLFYSEQLDKKKIFR